MPHPTLPFSPVRSSPRKCGSDFSPQHPFPSNKRPRRSPIPQLSNYYVPPRSFLREDDNPRILGESSHGAPDASNDDEDVPIRTLDNFVIYDIRSGELVSPNFLVTSCPPGKYGAAGLVRPHTHPDTDDEDDEEPQRMYQPPKPGPDVHSGQFVQLSPIKKLNLHDFMESERRFDPRVYILTQHAWYILNRPSTQYMPFYSGFLSNTSLLHHVLSSCLRDPTCTRKDFRLILKALMEGPSIGSQYLNSPLSMEDLDSESLMLYAHSILPFTLDLLPSKLYHKLCGAPLLGPFLSNPEAEHASEKSYTSGSDAPPTSEDESENESEDEGRGEDKASSSSKASSLPSRPLSGIKSICKPKPKPKFSPTSSSSPTVVTPTVWQLARTVYNEHQLKMVGDLDTGESAGLEEEEDITHHFDPVHVKWGRFLEKEDEVAYYEGVTLDGVEYVSGDYLIVVPGEDSLKERELNHHSDAAQSANKYAACYWFCQVSYFYEEDNEKWAHYQWFSPGCKTMLQELAHPQSLYLLYECDDIPINSILKKCEVKTLVQEEKEPAPGLHDPSSTIFHCSLVWDKENTDFTDLPFQKEVDYALSLLPPHKPCLSCGQEEKKRLHHQLSRVHRGFGLDGTSYHHHDFVYLPPEVNSSENLLLHIGQIIAMSGIPTGKSLVTVQIFERFDHIDSEPDDWEDSPKPASGLAKDDCHWCMEADAAMVRKRSELLLRHGPLIGLELFAGAEGLGTGMDLSGWVKTQYVVELGKAAAESYSYNHPGTNVYCQDVNSLLEFVVRRDEGHSLPYLPNGIGGLCTSLPKRGEVDFIFGGAPCQAFSGINHTRKADDIRYTLVCNMLSWVEHYQPTYFLLENVPGLLRFRLLAEQGENGSLIGGIKMGVVKFVQRTLIALGYQVHHKILEAAQ
ncbi:hypothetical protein ONZ45_g18926 [Pleurotus djamor]|nr:hypothetical protein ONZ45_g18926 [Pleurotus djamor]